MATVSFVFVATVIVQTTSYWSRHSESNSSCVLYCHSTPVIEIKFKKMVTIRKVSGKIELKSIIAVGE